MTGKTSSVKLWSERERLSVTLKSIGDGVISTDGSGNIQFINPTAERLTGWDQVDAVGQPLRQHFPHCQCHNS